MFRHPGRTLARSQRIAVTLLASASATAAFAQSPALAPVVVTATRVPMAERDLVGDVSVIGPEQLRTAGQTTLGELLAMQPGIQFQSNGGPGKAASLFIRGTTTNQSLVLIDGMRINSATTGQAAIHDIPVEQIERIEILRGPASSLYGADAIGGVVQIFTRRGEGAPRPFASLGIGTDSTTTASAGLRGAVGATKFSIAASHYQTNAPSAVRNPASFLYNPDRDPYRNFGLTGSLSHDFNADHGLGATAFLARAKGHFDSGPGFDHTNEDTVSSWQVYSRNRFHPAWTSTVRLGQSVDDSTSLFGPNDFDRAVFKTRSEQLQWQNDIRLGGFGTLTAGYDRLKQAVSGTTAYTVSERTNDAVYAGYTQALGRHSFQASARHDDNSQFGDANTYYAGYAFALTPALKAGLAQGTGFRAPTFNELYFPRFGFLAIDGTRQIEAERSRNREAFLRFNQGAHNASVTLYQNVITGLVTLTPTAAGNLVADVTARAEIRGTTVAYAYAGATWSAGASYDYLDAVDASGGANDGKMLPRRARNNATGWVGLRMGVWSLRTEALAQSERWNNTANTQRMGGYTIINVVAGYRIDPSWSLQFRFNNVLDKVYETASDFAMPRRSALLSVHYAPR